MEEEDEDTEEEEEEEEEEGEASERISEVEKLLLRNEFVSTMQMRFLRGEDRDFDYRYLHILSTCILNELNYFV